MMKLLSRVLLLFAFILLSTFAEAQNFKLDSKIPLDTNITVGKLDNGLRYYIKKNVKPEDRAILRLVVNAGSVLEDEDQLGLAHFVEHMGFNGTKNFKKHELVDYLESIGMKFGPEVNAYTSFDETVYMLDVPTDSAEMLDKGFQILEDWAHNVSFEDDEIDKERGVIVEEWRLGRGAWARIMDKQYPVIFKNSQYAVRLPIGKMDIVKNFPHSVLRRFYKDWYRPDLMAVVAVGDFNKAKIENLIKEHFNRLVNPKDERTRKLFDVPDNKGTLYTIETDPEATQNYVSVYFKEDVKPEDKVSDYRNSIVENLYNGMLNARLRELSQQADPPFVYGYSSKGRMIRTKNLYNLTCVVKDGGIQRGLDAILTEAARVKQHGFTETELERQKKSMLRSMEKAFNERNKTQSSRLASEYIRNYLYNEPVPGISYEYEAYKKFLPGISLDEVNQLANKLMTKDNRVVAVAGPEKKDSPMPTKEELAAIFKKVDNTKVAAYEDKVANVPLLEKTPSSSKVINTKNFDDLKVTEWTLGNGVKVVLKPTDFKNDEVLFRAFSPGGNSLVEDSDYIPATTASAIIQLSGVGKFNYTQLQKMLAGKVVNVSPFVGELSEGMNGSASPKDLETMFKLIYLYFTAPRADSSAYLSYQSRIRSYLANRDLSPNAAFSDTISVTLAQYHPRRQPFTEATLDKMNLQKSFNIYKNRFADASDFTFVFVGNFDKEKIKPLIETYLGGLPSIKRKEYWKNLHIDPPKGVISKELKKGIEPKSMVILTFTGPYNWGYQHNFDLYAMRSVLDIKLRELLREDKSGTYGVRVSSSGQKYPDQEYDVSIMFGCAPERVNEMVNALFKEIDSLKTTPVDDIYITKVKETQKRQWEVESKENSFWVGTLQKYFFYDMDLSQIMKNQERIDGLTKKAIMDAAKKYLNEKNYVKVVLYPQKT